MTQIQPWLNPTNARDLAAGYITSTQQQRRADHTRAAYESDWLQWTTWLGGEDRVPDSVEGVIVAMAVYLEHLNTKTPQATATTMRRRLAGTRSGMLDRGLPWPMFPPGRNTFNQRIDIYARDQARKIHKAPPIGERMHEQMLSACGPTVWGVRARAILAVGFLAAMRRSEISGLDLADVDFRSQGVVLTIRRSKTDQAASNTQAYIPLTKRPENCATRALHSWLTSRGDQPGPLFVSLRKGHVNPICEAHRIEPALVNTTVRDVAALIGATGYTAHSLRAGLVTTGAEYGASSHDLMKQSRHRSVQTLEGYIRDGRGFEDNVVKLLDL